MKTDKIKQIHSVKPWNSSNGVIHYHNLEMENGDKINIGKKSQMQVGWEITYEITEYGQQEFQPAKPLKKPEIAPAPQTQKKQVDWDAREKGIRIGHALNNAVQIVVHRQELPAKERIKHWATMILELSEELNNEVS